MTYGLVLPLTQCCLIKKPGSAQRGSRPGVGAVADSLELTRAGGASQVPEIIGGKGGTRTLDPGIMSAGPKGRALPA
jgi:hypothetical protein